MKEKLNATKEIEFVGDINVKHLKARTINRLNISALSNDLLLKANQEQSILNGDLVAENLVNVENLFVDSISNVPAANFLNVRDDQNIAANVFINKFHTSNLTTKLLNEKDFSDATVATVSSPNVIKPTTRF